MKMMLSGSLASVLLLLTTAIYADSYGLGNSYSPTSSSSSSGFNAGVQAGYGYNSVDTPVLPSNVLGKLSFTKRGFSGRAYVGYNLNQYVGLQLGGAYLPHLQAKLTLNNNSVTVTQDQYDIDLLALGFLPLGDQFFVYAGAGPAVIIADRSVSGNHVEMIQVGSAESYIRPEIAGGVGYKVTNNVSLTANYNRIFTIGHNKSIPTMNVFTAGMQYSF